jgi:two-component system phosphate regulon sensor histidine kinase PhoR
VGVFAQTDKEAFGIRPDTEMVLRTSVSVASLDKTLAGIRLRIGIGALAVLLVASLVTLLISRNISKPLEQMTKSAERFSRGDFGKRMLPQAKKTASLEVITLAASMDRMAEELDEKIAAIVSHRNQLETVFSSMVEAVLAIDAGERVISLNDAAADIFSVDKNDSCGRLVQEIVRDVKLQQQISHTLTTRESIEDETLFHTSNGERFLQINVVPLNNGGGEQLGVLLVLNDVTRLRRLEKVRRDFVANVSHELRTPITSIRGYVETLLDGALDNRQDAEKFLKIVSRQSVRLTSIIDDLLILSRVEENLRQGEIDLEKNRILPVIEAAVQTCEGKAEKGRVTVRYSCDENCAVPMNAPLLEQAIVNLLVNAITYSMPDSDVFVEVTGGTCDDDLAEFVRIAVRDKGCGIGAKHIPRVFERFYRSDRARSRQHGGTGLGLAIVKHISQAHNGSVELKSAEGEGSEFTLILPS